MIDGQPVVFFCMPCGSSDVKYGAVRGQYCATSGQGKYRVLPDNNGHSALTYNFNVLYSRALNARNQVPGGIDYFAMIHSDVLPMQGSIEILVDELRLLGADMLSTVIPLKGPQGWTSTGIDTSTGIRRLTMHEVMRLPESFGRQELTGAGFPSGTLLLNTGLWVMDFKKPWVDDPRLLQKGFWVEGGIRKEQDGTFQPWFESEDWNWSRDVQRLFGAKCYATRKAKVWHQGDTQFQNWDAWGTDLIDSAWRPAPAIVPPVSPNGKLSHIYHSIQGWFDFSDLYQHLVKQASDGDRFVEVGAWRGKSTTFLAVEMANSGKQLYLDVIDTWRGSVGQPEMIEEAAKKDIFAEFEANMARTGIPGGIVSVFRMDSLEAAKNYPDHSASVVYIDASHDYSSVKADIQAWLPKIRPGGVLAGHDYDTKTDMPVVQAVNELLGQRGLQVMGRSWLVRV